MTTASKSGGALSMQAAHFSDAAPASRLLPAWYSPALKVTVLLLALTGFGQMPIYNRYWVTSLPGLGWTGDFYLTHTLHYIFAAVFMGLLTYAVIQYAGRWRRRLKVSFSGKLRAALYLGVVVTGIVRVLKNLPQMFFDPTTVMLTDILHLASVMLLGAAALVALVRGWPYLLKRN